MPDHVHLLLTPAPEIPLEKAVQLIKGGFSFRFKSNFDVWERSYDNRRIADSGQYDACIKYMIRTLSRRVWRKAILIHQNRSTGLSILVRRGFEAGPGLKPKFVATVFRGLKPTANPNSIPHFLPLYVRCRKPHPQNPRHPCASGRQSHIIVPACLASLHTACGQPGKPARNRAQMSACPHSSRPPVAISKPCTAINRGSRLHFAAISTLPRPTSTTTVSISYFTLFLRSLSRTLKDRVILTLSEAEREGPASSPSPHTRPNFSTTNAPETLNANP